VWPQCWDLQGPRGLEQRDLRNLNLGDLKKGPNGGVSPTPPKKILRRKSGRDPTLPLCMTSVMYPQKKKSMGVKSGIRGGQLIGPSCRFIDSHCIMSC
jgi:hypothetical protein